VQVLGLVNYSVNSGSIGNSDQDVLSRYDMEFEMQGEP
jgi:hypothetical protein